MPRKRRSDLPGAAFHLTSRTSGHDPWWSDPQSRNSIAGFIADALRRTDAQLIAFAIMANHFHLLVWQGCAPLARLMHSLCCRTALMVRKKHGREGRIFERAFRDKPCADSEHMRNIIYYTHRNPVKAGMCNDFGEYPWSSFHAYSGTRAVCQAEHGVPLVPITPALELFATSADCSIEDMHAGYLRFAEWRGRCDQLPDDVRRPPGPLFPWGDMWWSRRITPAPPEVHRRDLRDIVLNTIRELAPWLDFDVLRLRRGGPEVTAVRHAAIARAIAAGHPGAQIARFLNVSDCTVSRVADRVFRAKATSRPSEEGAEPPIAEENPVSALSDKGKKARKQKTSG